MSTTTINITEPERYLSGVPHEDFAELRRMPGLYWHPYGSNGFWAVTRHADVKEVSKAPEIFSSAIGHTNLWDLEADALEARRSILDSDAPDHTRLRRLVAKAFTPRNLGIWEDAARQITRDVLDDFEAAGGGDFVELIAAPLPIRVILSILGIPLEDGGYLVELTNYLVEGTGDRPSLPDDAFGNTTPVRLLPFASPASHALFEYGDAIANERRQSPGPDIVTLLAQAEDDGYLKTHDEFRNFFHALVFAGNETTRTALTHGAMALAAYPDQWEMILADASLIDGAVEEILRWATPVLHMRRTAATDTELSGTRIAAGDKVVMWYVSANRDEAVYDDPYTFDITRDNSVQQAFGGGGPHFCLGAYLARLEIRVLLEELRARTLRLRQTGAAVHARSNFVHGILSVGMEPA